MHRKGLLEKAIILLIIFSLTIIPITPERVQAAASGTWDCGKVAGTVTATLDADGNMVISGNGYMQSFAAPTDQPWYGSKDLIKSLVVEGGVISISDYAFTTSKNLASVTLESGVRSLGKYAFSGCTNLTSIELSNTMVQILENAFAYTAITSIHLPSTLTWINWNIFESCTKLKTIEIPKFDYVGSMNFNADTSYEQGTFTKSSIENFIIPSNVTDIYPYQYYGYAGFTSYTIPDNVKSIGQYSFYKTKLISMDIPDNVKSIGQYAFGKCTSLANVYIYSNDVNIASNAFAKSTIIHGFASSTAKGYASANGLTFELIEDIAPSVSLQSKTFDKYVPTDVTFNVNLGVGSLKATTVKDVQIDDVSIDSSKWSRNASTIKIDKSVFSSLDKGTSHFITAVFDDFSDTSVKNVKVSIVDTIPDKVPSIQQGSIAFNKDSDSSVSFTADLGLGALSATNVSDVMLNNVSLLPTDWNYSNGKITINKSALSGALIGSAVPISVKFNDAVSTLGTGLSITINGTKTLPDVLAQSVKYTGTSIPYNIAFNEYNKSVKAVVVNGQELPVMYWTISGTTLTLSDDYLNILSNGLYTVNVVYDSDSVLTGKLSFTVPKDTSGVTPQTSLLNVIYVSGSNSDLDISLPGSTSSVAGFYINSSEVDNSAWSFNTSTKRLTISHDYLNSLGVGTRSMILTLNYEGTLTTKSIMINANLGAGAGVLGASAGDIGIIISSITVGTTGLTYRVDEHGNTIIDGYTGGGTNVTIPSDVNGSPVTGIDNLGSKPVDTVKIPDSVTNINNGAINSGTTIIGNTGSAAENYANNNGNTFKDNGNGGSTGGSSGGNTGGSNGNTEVNSVEPQTINFDLASNDSPVVKNVKTVSGVTVDYIIINGFKVWFNGVVEPITVAKSFNILEFSALGVNTAATVTQSAISYSGTPFSYDKSTGNITIDSSLLKLLSLDTRNDYSVEVGFSDGSVISNAITMKVTDSNNTNGENGGGTGTPGGNTGGTGNTGTPGGNTGGTGNTETPGGSTGGTGNTGTPGGNTGGTGNTGTPGESTGGTGSTGTPEGNTGESGGTDEDGAGNTENTVIGSNTNFSKTLYLQTGSKIKIRPLNGAKYQKYVSSNNRVIKVTSDGFVTANKAGSCSLYVRVNNGKVLKFMVVVKDDVEGNPYVVYSSKTGYVGGKDRLYSQFSNVTYKSSEMMPVDKSGNIKFLKSGKYTVTVTEREGLVIISHIVNYSVQKGFITIKYIPKSMKINTTIDLVGVVTDSADNELVWMSSDKKVAKISANGKLVVLRKGKAKITAVSGNIKKTFLLEIK